MRAFFARLLRKLTPATLSAQLAVTLIGGIILLHAVATFTVQLLEERQAARSALLEQANSLALSLQLLHAEPFEYKRSLLERLERLDVVHLSLGDTPDPARQAPDERSLYLRQCLGRNLASLEARLDARTMLTEVQRVHVADSMNPTLRRHVPWTHVYESRVSVRLEDGKWLCVVISSDAHDFSPSSSSVGMLMLEAGLIVLLILLVVHRVVRPLRLLSGKAESFGRDLHTAPMPEDGPAEVREAARAFNKMQERIRASVGQHRRILAAVAHDLRTPLTRIRLRVESMDPGDPLRAKLLGDIGILGGIMANSAELTRDALRDEPPVRMDMNALLDSLVSDRQDMGQDVRLEGSCRQPWTVRPNSLRRCLSNLLDNALHYSGSVRIRVGEEAEDVLRIEVLDHGPGIPPELLERVFEPFFRLDEARSPHTGGSGLGLSIARSMACRNGGELSLHNRPEGGLCARLRLYRTAGGKTC
ncbi:ATP-binding protein [uncultured Desulfovibrio sp.]|uniref:ATP-binding protein n=1 Tax=uncultured Desulfovibrio sp. TaxID=167968 RepID=UPI0026243D1B|nr:ATP-binding protein [uncultured Desulfovibrio sp.]